jgi:hypothetical protein
VYGDAVIISRRHFENAGGKFFTSIFDVATTIGIIASVLVSIS